MPVQCKLCNKQFSKQGNANRHFREIHTKEAEEDEYKKREWSYHCLEENCDVMFPQVKALINHLEIIHQLTFETVLLSLENLEEFAQWKSSIELSYNCQYIIKNRFRNSEEKETLYLTCNRSKASYCPKPLDQRKRLLKHDLLKLHYSCTSGMKVVVNDDSVEVAWQKYHYGHDLDFNYLKSPKQKFGKQRPILNLEFKHCPDGKNKVNMDRNGTSNSIIKFNNDHTYAYYECQESGDNTQTDMKKEPCDTEWMEEISTKDENANENKIGQRDQFPEEFSNNVEYLKSLNLDHENLEESDEYAKNDVTEKQKLSENETIDGYPADFSDGFSKNEIPDENPTHIEFYDIDEILEESEECSVDENSDEFSTDTDDDETREEYGDTNRNPKTSEHKILVEYQTNSISEFYGKDSTESDDESRREQTNFEDESSEIEASKTNSDLLYRRTDKDHEEIIIHVVDEESGKRSYITDYVESDLENPIKRQKYWEESQNAIQQYKKDNRDLFVTNTQMQETIRRLQVIANELRLKQ